MKLMNQYPATYKIMDVPSGKEYIFPAGQVVEVDPQDVSQILEIKRKMGGCCNAPYREMQVFVEVPE